MPTAPFSPNINRKYPQLTDPRESAAENDNWSSGRDHCPTVYSVILIHQSSAWKSPSMPTSSIPIRGATRELLTPFTAFEVRSRKSHRMSCAQAVLYSTGRLASTATCPRTTVTGSRHAPHASSRSEKTTPCFLPSALRQQTAICPQPRDLRPQICIRKP
jgi:hypothetical protein